MLIVATDNTRLGRVEYGLRPYDASDEAIVIDPWISKAAAIEPLAGLTREELDAHRLSVIVPTLKRLGALVACDPVDPRVVLGWSCAEVRGGKQVCHFVFVKSPARRCGIATGLLGAQLPKFKIEKTYFTHATKQLVKMKGKWNAAFNPYLARA